MTTFKFKKGDRVKRTNFEHCGMKVGDVGTVAEVRDTGYSVRLHEPEYNTSAVGGMAWHAAYNLELLVEPITTPANLAPTPRFKPGQHIVCVNATSLLKHGWIYTVDKTVAWGRPLTNYVELAGVPGNFLEDRFELSWEPGVVQKPEEVLAEPEQAPDLKPTNPKDAIGNRKLQLGLLPFAFQAHASLALTDGKYKYGANNWTIGGVRASIYIDALLRHIQRWNNGQRNDPDSNVHNLGHAAACIAILLDAEARGVLNDDRPPAVPAELLAQLQVQFNDATGKLIDTHVAAGRAPHHWTIQDGEGSGDAD